MKGKSWLLLSVGEDVAQLRLQSGTMRKKVDLSTLANWGYVPDAAAPGRLVDMSKVEPPPGPELEQPAAAGST
eukprot:COSAG02_NODE_67819_length_252_cov_0.660131_1_plen_72_part_01